VDWFIDGSVVELYDVEVLPGIACPMAVSGSGELAESPTGAHLFGWNAGEA
jgi:hypothetical protein